MLSVSNPGPSVLRLARLRANSPAPATSSVDSATCATTSVLRSRACWTPPPAALDFFLERAVEVHGRPAQRRRQAEQQRRERRDDQREGEHPRGRAWSTAPRRTRRAAARRPADRRATPRRAARAAPPSAATSALSTSVCRTRRDRLAPIARRTLISRCRPVARASIRLATLAQAMSSTRPTMPISTATGPDRSPRICDRPREASCSTRVLARKRALNSVGRWPRTAAPPPARRR